MRKLVLGLALLGSAIATPALAQDYGRYGYGYYQGYGSYGDRQYRSTARLRDIGWQIERGIRSGAIAGREAWVVRREYGYLVGLDRQLSYGGQSRWEARRLDDRIDALERRVRFFRTNDYRYGYDGRLGAYGDRDWRGWHHDRDGDGDGD